jgi:uncharacterized protein (DUF433 family)
VEDYQMTTTELVNLDRYFEGIGSDAIKLKGHRIGIEHVLIYYLEGYNPDEIAREFPGLSLEKIYATITYYLANREEIDSYLQRRAARNEQAYQEWVVNPSPVIERLRFLRQKNGEDK